MVESIYSLLFNWMTNLFFQIEILATFIWTMYLYIHVFNPDCLLLEIIYLVNYLAHRTLFRPQCSDFMRIDYRNAYLMGWSLIDRIVLRILNWSYSLENVILCWFFVGTIGYYLFTMKANKNSSKITKIIAGLHRSFNLFTLGYIKSKNAYLMKNLTHFSSLSSSGK